ncbi:membrane-spanning 4-domains subfamily A member 4D-like [Polyodon spathula]|uniref:membrane-spanning 4-domains subfamily A member 4D-like n=1 Tax=Polyodon spathula TaxID=7913 RepID=UPI001B7F47F5|nr:membrane-spanning 4-domains subfamily A member 4D-like [Polyodon spathula]
MKTMPASAGGVVVVTQFYPQAPPDNGPPALAGVPRCQVFPSGSLCQPSGQLKRFLKGEPRVLGTVQIIVGVINILFGVVLSRTLWSVAVILGAPFWTGVFYIISGSLSVAADRTPRISLVKGTLAMNVLSSIAAGIGIIIYLVDLAVWSRCKSYPHHSSGRDDDSAVLFNSAAQGLKSVLLLFTILEFCVAISVSAFGCKAVCHGAQDQTPMVVIQSTCNTASAPSAGVQNIYSLAAPPFNPSYTPLPPDGVNPPPYKT